VHCSFNLFKIQRFTITDTCPSALTITHTHTHTHTHAHPFNGPLSGTTQVSRYHGKTNLDLNEARDSEWQWHQLGHMQVCTSLQTDNHASTPVLQAGCPSCRPTNSVKTLKAPNHNSNRKREKMFGDPYVRSRPRERSVPRSPAQLQLL